MNTSTDQRGKTFGKILFSVLSVFLLLTAVAACDDDDEEKTLKQLGKGAAYYVTTQRTSSIPQVAKSAKKFSWKKILAPLAVVFGIGALKSKKKENPGQGKDS